MLSYPQAFEYSCVSLPKSPFAPLFAMLFSILRLDLSLLITSLTKPFL